MAYIFHITRRETWAQAQAAGLYRSDTLDSERFIHCSNPEQIMAVANTFYFGQHGLVLLCIDTDKLQSELRYEAPNGDNQSEKFPHVYGPLSLEAVVKAVGFEPGPDGRFLVPGRTVRFG